MDQRSSMSIHRRGELIHIELTRHILLHDCQSRLIGKHTFHLVGAQNALHHSLTPDLFVFTDPRHMLSPLAILLPTPPSAPPPGPTISAAPPASPADPDTD